MPQYKISGVWKVNGTITHYAVHSVVANGITRAEKISKADAIALVESRSNIVMTWVWNYRRSYWDDGEVVQVVELLNSKYLRSNPDGTVTDNLAHLINFDWVTP